MVRATLLHDPTVEGLDMAIYMDGSASMSDEYENKAKTRSFWEWITSKPPEILPNMVEPQVHWMLEYLATKDRNGLLRVAYWACGEGGSQIEVIGELSGVDAKKNKFPGPIKMGRRTMLVPALKDYVNYMRNQVKEGAKQGCAVIITDGELHDADEVKAYSKQIAADIVGGRLPKMNFVLVGVGKGVNEEQLEEICHAEYPGLGHMWCHRIAEEITEVAQLVAVLVDENMTVAAGGTVYDDRGGVVKVYEARLPAVLEFSVYEGCKSFTLEVSGQKH
ncbi:hypothetical protein ABS71_22765, partial [bacterium SCN 62-11]